METSHLDSRGIAIGTSEKKDGLYFRILFPLTFLPFPFLFHSLFFPR